MKDNYTRHEELCEFMNTLYIEKNKKYGDSFTMAIDRYGKVAMILRLYDKFNRAERLILGFENGSTDESLTDTLIDLANYSLMIVMYLERDKEEL